MQQSTEAPVQRRGSYAKGTRRRDEILDAALRVIGAQGVEAATTGAIAAAVGLSQTGMAHYFPTRTGLFISVLTERDRRDLERAGGRPGLPALLQTVDRNVRTPALVLLYVSLSASASDPGHEAHDFFRRHHAELLDAVTEDLAAGQSDGTVRADLPAPALARLLVAAADGLQLQWLLEPNLDMVEILDLLLGLMRP